MLWLLFRLMFGSGAVKLASGDPTWRNLTALAVSLRNAADSHAARMVRASSARVVQQGIDGGSPRD